MPAVLLTGGWVGGAHKSAEIYHPDRTQLMLTQRPRQNLTHDHPDRTSLIIAGATLRTGHFWLEADTQILPEVKCLGPGDFNLI